MTKSELIERIATHQKQLSPKDVELAVKMIIEYMALSLAGGNRIEIRASAAFRCTIANRGAVAIPRPATRSIWSENTCRTSSPARRCVNASTRMPTRRSMAEARL